MNKILKIKLNNGVEIPGIGNGPGILRTLPRNIESYPFGERFSLKVYNKLVKRPLATRKYIDVVANAFNIGFTLLDNSAAYGNEHYIAKAIKKSNLKREELFITTRCTNKAQREKRVREEFLESLKKLGTDYVDLYQFHWPVTGCYLDTWKEMEKLYKEGYCKAIGVANCHQHHLEAIKEVCEIIPAINQVEVHPLFTQKELIKYCQENGIVVEAYTAIARFDDRLMRLPLLKGIGKKHNKTVVQVILRWHIQNGVIPVVRSLNKKRQLENISIFDFELTPEEMKAIDGVNINSRLRYDPDNCDFSIL